MAQKQTVSFLDDLDGTLISGVEQPTVRFGLDGVSYEIDLGPKNQVRLRQALAPYLANGRRLGSRTGTSTVSRAYDSQAIRKWAIANKVDISARGRIPAEIVERFKAEGN